jgi:flagella basal body P-ring formation protein FlgA
MTAKPLGKYQPIDADDIRIKRVNLARVPSNAIMDANQVLGRRPNRNIAANCVLRNDQVELPPVIKRGDVVQVVAESSILRIEAKAMAKENGVVGDRIQVMNLRSKKIIYAQVMDGQTVEVEF